MNKNKCKQPKAVGSDTQRLACRIDIDGVPDMQVRIWEGARNCRYGTEYFWEPLAINNDKGVKYSIDELFSFHRVISCVAAYLGQSQQLELDTEMRELLLTYHSILYNAFKYEPDF